MSTDSHQYFLAKLRLVASSAAAATATTARWLRLRDNYRNLAVAERVAIETFDRGFSLFLRLHLDEAESTGFASLSVFGHVAGNYIAELGEELLQLTIGGGVGKVSNEKFVVHNLNL